MYGLDNTFSDIGAGAVYPTQGPSTAALATGDAYPAVSDAVPMIAGPAASSGYGGNPIVGFFTFIVFVILIMVIARKLGSEEGYANIRGSLHDVLFIGLVAAAGIPAIKIGTRTLAQMFSFLSPLNAWAQAA
jgi:hypothetical protein